MRTFEFELNVPSGVMVFGDSLPGFEILGSFDTNTQEGLVKQTMAMARIGCAHAFVGNSCPGVYQRENGPLFVADVPKKMAAPGVYRGSIITDLWWYSFADLDEYNRRCGDQEWKHGQVKVRPGVYTFKHMLPGGHNHGSKTVYTYATITWIREPDPVQDYLKDFREAQFSAGQVISHKISQWPTLYSGEKGVMAAANHIFCVIGGGEDWHPNGFVVYDPDIPKETPEVLIPEFDRPFSWYPLSEYSALIRAADSQIHLNNSFARLAKNVARCIARHGSIIMPESIRNPRNEEIAQECLRKLEMLYP